jgi:NTP pyrophosphatase (non-canonical NTP hydrolase)
MRKYIEDAQRTKPQENHLEDFDPDELGCTLKASLASLEVIDQIKKKLFYNKPMSLSMETPQEEIFEFKGIDIEVIHGILGILSEAAELGQVLLDAAMSGLPLDQLDLKDELGDVMWYQALILNSIGSNFEEAGESNIAKLRERFPDKFDASRAINPNKEVEKSVI